MGGSKGQGQEKNQSERKYSLKNIGIFIMEKEGVGEGT
jgi:hypothetical protein